MTYKYRLKALIFIVAFLIINNYFYAAVEGRALAAGFEIEKVFEYEGGNVVTDKMATYGISLSSVYPSSYASLLPTMGNCLVYFDGEGTPVKYGGENPSVTYYPATNGKYFLKTSGPSCWEPRMESEGVVREYYTRDGELLWRDDGTGDSSGGLVCVSPDGERVVYVRRGAPPPLPNLIFRNREGNVIAENRLESLDRTFNFSEDGRYFLIAEYLRGMRNGSSGTAVFDRDGQLLFFMDTDKATSSNTYYGYGVLGGLGDYVIQTFEFIERSYDENRTAIGYRVVPNRGGGIQVYNAKGFKIWERNLGIRAPYYFKIANDGEYLAFVEYCPPSKYVLYKLATGEVILECNVNMKQMQFPVMTISDDGSRCCISLPTHTPEGVLVSGPMEVARFAADVAGHFKVSHEGKYVIFSGDDSFVLFILKTEG